MFDALLKNKGMDALPPVAPSRARTSRSNRREASSDPRRSFNVG